MPNPLISKYAVKAKTTEAKVEEIWRRAKEEAYNRFRGNKSPQYWAYVNAIVQRRLGLREGKITFKDMLVENENL